MNSQCTCICLVVLKSKKHCVHIHSLNFRRKKIPYKNRRYDNLSLSDLKMFHVITVSSLTDWHLSVEGSVRPDEGWGDTVFGLLAHSLSTKSSVFCPAFLQLFRKMDMGSKSHHLSSNALYRDSIRVSLEIVF